MKKDMSNGDGKAGEGKEKKEGQAGGDLSKEALEKRDQASAKADQALSMAKELKDEKVLKEYVEMAEYLPHLPIEPLKFGG